MKKLAQIAGSFGLASLISMPRAVVAAPQAKMPDLLTSATPRAVAAVPRADATDPKALVEQIQRAFEEFKATNDETLKAKADDSVVTTKLAAIEQTMNEVQAALDEHSNKLAAAALGGTKGIAADPDYTTKFSAFVRDGAGEAEIKAAQKSGPRGNVRGSSADGGLLTPVEWDRTITERLKLISPIRQMRRCSRSARPASQAVHRSHGRLRLGRRDGGASRDQHAAVHGARASRPARSTRTRRRRRICSTMPRSISSTGCRRDRHRVLPPGGHRLPVRRRHQQAVRHPHLHHRRRATRPAPVGRDPGGRAAASAVTTDGSST
jgi:enamine deaminase RidA (YjgF/YER057c/UK114 family)